MLFKMFHHLIDCMVVIIGQCWGISTIPPILTSPHGFLPVGFPDLAQFGCIRLGRPDKVLELSFFPLFKLNSHDSVHPEILRDCSAIGDTLGYRVVC